MSVKLHWALAKEEQGISAMSNLYYVMVDNKKHAQAIGTKEEAIKAYQAILLFLAGDFGVAELFIARSLFDDFYREDYQFGAK